MTAGELAVLLAAVLCSIGFAALIVVLLRVLDTLRSLRTEVATLRAETGPLLAELQQSTRSATAVVAEARNDLERFDRVLGSAEAISDAVSGTGIVARTAFSTPVIKTAAIATGTSRAVRKLRGKDEPRRRGAAVDRVDLAAAPRVTGTVGPAAEPIDITERTARRGRGRRRARGGVG
ncbi:MAG: DUF948 domain-containing protein [Ilumatobacteraceae bacterium]|nr:DUF948 domain-containing protein [Acidimicrobiales bacterium]MCB9394520.1 DUF948 domain-containing protein [Acidimicrobiaceae bacterium]